MSKVRIIPNLLICGTAFSLLLISGDTGFFAPAAYANNIYIAPENSPTVRPLGQLDEHGQPYPSQTGTSSADESGVNRPRDNNTDTLQPVRSGDVTYVTGGIGDEERNELQAVEKDYNFHVTSATRDGAFVGDTRIVLLNRSGGELVNTEAGPIFYAELPDGRYTLQASREGMTQTRKIIIRHGKTAHVHLSW